MLRIKILLTLGIFLFGCSSYGNEGGDLVREFAYFSIEKMVLTGVCKSKEDCIKNERVLFSETNDGFHLTFYNFSDRIEIDKLIESLVEEYEAKGVKVKMSLSFSKEKHMPNKGLFTLKQRKQPFIQFVIYQGA